MLRNGVPPRAGELQKLPTLAKTFRKLAEHGKAGFYEGEVARAIVDVVSQLGGIMSLEDLKSHKSTFEQPVHVNYRGVDVYEMPPNGQGITALMALRFLEGFDISKLPFHSTEHLHLLIESLRFAFADARAYVQSFCPPRALFLILLVRFVADPAFSPVPVAQMLSEEYSTRRRALYNPLAAAGVEHGAPQQIANTVYFSVVDGSGNACSFINSNCAYCRLNDSRKSLTAAQTWGLVPAYAEQIQSRKYG